MKLTASELAYVRSQGLDITERCDGCGKLLNQALRYTIAGKPELYCSAACRELAFFGDRREAKKQRQPTAVYFPVFDTKPAGGDEAKTSVIRRVYQGTHRHASLERIS